MEIVDLEPFEELIKNLVDIPDVKTILETVYQDKTQVGPWVAGGMGRQLALNDNDFNDIDIWFNSPVQLKEVKERLIEKFSSCIEQTYDSDNAESFNIGIQKVQFIKRHFFKSIDEVFDAFDFICCQIAVDENLNIYGPGIEDAQKYILKTNFVDTKTFLARYGKYISYGYKMDPNEFLNIINQYELSYEFDGSTFGY